MLREHYDLLQGMAAQGPSLCPEAGDSRLQDRGSTQRAIDQDLDLKELESKTGLDILLKRLDKQWSFDGKVEMPNNLGAFFFKLKRRQHQTLLEYTAEFHQVLRQVTKHKVDLPDKVTGWMMLKRAGLTREQEQMVQTQIGSSSPWPLWSNPFSCWSDRTTSRSPGRGG